MYHELLIPPFFYTKFKSGPPSSVILIFHYITTYWRPFVKECDEHHIEIEHQISTQSCDECKQTPNFDIES